MTTVTLAAAKKPATTKENYEGHNTNKQENYLLQGTHVKNAFVSQCALTGDQRSTSRTHPATPTPTTESNLKRRYKSASRGTSNKSASAAGYTSACSGTRIFDQ
mmetsp:Transcript_5164/g.14513  ORF Transcript_5164/g.14513 Transcript_5164/m.14513 type:complete len:104 (-) Transcript_5164:2721-3032(-)